MDRNNINNIFSELRQINYITTAELKKLSLNYNDINKFIEKGYLKRVAKGYYKTNVTGKDFNIKDSKLKQAKDCIRNNEIDKALDIMKTYPYLETSAKACFILFKIFFLKEKYYEAKTQLLKSIYLSKDNAETKEFILLLLEEIIRSKDNVKKLELENKL